MKASDAIAHVLADNRVTYGFELIGGMITDIVDSINLLGKTKLVSMHHEQGAGFAAGAISRATNGRDLGVALGTSGPGATNLITPVADCWLDSHSCVFITGQVNTLELKGSRKIRQQGFQELDAVSLVESITKYAVQIEKPEQVVPELRKAIRIAREGRPGPVLIDIPMDLQRVEIPEVEVLKSVEDLSEIRCTPDIVSKFSRLFSDLEHAQKPLFLIGGGAINCNRFREWCGALNTFNLPYVASLKGAEKVIMSEMYLGMLGAYGTRAANQAVQECDLLVVVGSRLDVRQTGAMVDQFADKAKIYQIDIDQAQLNNRVEVHEICGSSSEFVERFFSKQHDQERSEWKNRVSYLKNAFPKDEYPDLELSPYLIFDAINNVFSGRKIQYSVDVGNNQMWAAHSLKLGSEQSAHYSAGLGAMGFAIPSSIGLYYGKKTPVVTITGDGGAQLNIQELDIIAREKLPILTIVFNNLSLGMVRNFQELYFSGRNSSTYWQGFTCNFAKISEGYSVESASINSMTSFQALLEEFRDNPRPLLIEFMMPETKDCRPRLEYGNPINKQSPAMSESRL